MEESPIDNQLEEPEKPIRDWVKKSVGNRAFVRRYIAIIMTSVVAYLAVIDKLSPEMVIALYGPIAGFYFGKAE